MSKRLFFLFVLVSMYELVQAQTPPPYEPYWSVEYQMGLINVNGEGNFFRMTSPSFSFNAEYRFSEPLGVRAVLGGFQGKGYVVRLKEYYRYHYIRGGADVMWYPSSFPVKNMYFFAGLGLMVGTSNGAQNVDVSFKPDYFEGLWSAPKVFVTGRIGAGYAYPLTDKISVTGEAAFSLYPDSVNSKMGGNMDCSLSLMAGIKYSFGPCRKKQKPQPVYVPQPAAPVEPVIAVVEEPAPEPAPVEVVPEPVVEPEPAVAEEVIPEPVRIYFTSDSAVIRDEYKSGLATLAQFLATHPDWYVFVEAYGDSKSGSAAHNQELSERRVASAVKQLKAAGVPKSRIQTVAGGGTNKFTVGKNVKKNRLVICHLLQNN